MTLARKTVLRLGALTAALAIAGAAAIWCLLMLQNLSAITREEFDELREIRPIERKLWDAAVELAENRREPAAALLDEVIATLDGFRREQVSGYSRLESAHAEREKRLADQSRAALDALRARLRSAAPPPSPLEETRVLREARQQLSSLTDEFERAVAAVHLRTTRRFEKVMLGLVLLFVAITAAAAMINLGHYRAVIGPLRYVRDGVGRLAGGALETRLAPRGDAEFVDLQRDFNAMAAELESLYRDLERRVAEQGRRLAVSERLASTGYLAAGVAHEINNPLAIMSGYAQSILRQLRDPAAPPATTELVRDLEVIRDEAFRAKKITQQLLDLSRGGDSQRSLVSLWRVIDDVTEIVRGANLFQGVSIERVGDKSEPLLVWGAEPELKQILLNLTMNAAQSLRSDGGRLELLARRSNGWVELVVRDNGCGMTPETLEHVFEPFYSGRKRSGGVGLGLTICHAIVRRHDGELLAASDGVGRGSVFTVRLPAAEERAP